MATRQTQNRRVTTTDNGGHKTEAGNVVAEETENARFEQLGPFRKANLAIDLAAVAMSVGGVDADAAGSMIASRAGAIAGIAYAFDAPVSAGGASAATIQAAVAPGGQPTALAAQGNAFLVASGGAQSAVLDESTGSIAKGLEKGMIPFKEGDLLGVLLSSSHTFAPTTADLDVYLLVRWAS